LRSDDDILGLKRVKLLQQPLCLATMSKNLKTLADPDEDEDEKKVEPRPPSPPRGAEQQVHRGDVPYHLRAARRADEAAIAKRYQKNLEESAQAGVAPDPNLKPFWIR
jgi:hypothetical protein